MGSIKSKCGKNAAAVEDVSKEEGGGIDTVSEATEVGGARNMGVNTNGELKKVMAEGRKEIKDAHEKLNSSLTTPVLSDHNGAEARILQEGQWLSEVKDLNRRYGALPPINAGNTIKPNAMAFTVD